MSTNVNTMKMPANYVDMNADELEYNGGWIWSAVISVAGWTCTVAGHLTKNQDLKNAGTILMGIGLITTGIGIYAGISAVAKTGEMAANVASNFAYSSSIGLGDAVAGLGSYRYW